jgi:type IV pilus assembly protein PilN
MKEKREFNFVRLREREQAKQAAHTSALRYGMIALGIGGTVIVLVIAGIPWLWTYKLDYDLQSVNQKITALSSIEIQVQKVNNLKSIIQRSQQFLDLVVKENHDPIEVLNKIKLLLPAGTVISSFSYTGDAINIAVSVPAPVDVARLWVSFRDSGIFQDVDIQSVSLADQVQDLNLVLKYNPKENVIVPAGN